MDLNFNALFFNCLDPIFAFAHRHRPIIARKNISKQEQLQEGRREGEGENGGNTFPSADQIFIYIFNIIYKNLLFFLLTLSTFLNCPGIIFF